MQDVGAAVGGELGPGAAGLGLRQRGVAVEHHAVNQLAAHAAAPCPVEGLEAVALHVHAERTHVVPGLHLAQRDVGGAALQGVLVGLVAVFLIGLRQAGVDEDAEQAVVAAAARVLRGLPLGHQGLPTQPAQRAVEAGQSEAAHLAGLRAGPVRHPGAGGQHAGLVVFPHLGAAVAAHVAHGRRNGAAFGRLVPLDSVLCVGAPLQRLQAFAVRARYVVGAAVALEVGLLDAAEVLGCRRAGAQVLAAGEGGLPSACKLHGVAFAVHVQRVCVFLVGEQVAHRHAAQAGGAVGAGDGQEAAGEFLQKRGVGFVAAAIFADLAA